MLSSVLLVLHFIYTCSINWDSDMGFYVALVVSQMIWVTIMLRIMGLTC